MKLKPTQFQFNPIIYLAKYHAVENDPSLITEFKEEMHHSEFLRFKQFREEMNTKLYDEAEQYFKNIPLEDT